MKALNWLAIGLWLVIGIYGIFYNITYIDEAKYLIKGWLITTGQVGYYTTPEFFYQHLPGGLLWFGLGQKLFGPNLLIARIQSFILGLTVMGLTYRLAKTIKPKAKNLILPFLALSPVAILYYSSAVPQSLAALTLVLAFYYLFKNKYYPATFWFSLAFIVRENFLFTLFFYLIYLFFAQRKIWIKQTLVATTIVSLFFLPGWPGTMSVLKNLPGISWLMPVAQAEKEVLSLNWQQQTHSVSLYLKAIKDFIAVYWPVLLVLILSLKQKPVRQSHWLFLLFITAFNFLAHAWSAFNLSPRSIVPYFAYIFPLVAVIAAVKINQINPVKLAALMLMTPVTLVFSSLFQPPNRLNIIKRLNQSTIALKPLVADKSRIIWLTEPMSLYLAGKVSYYPLLNYTNFYKPCDDTETVKRLGFWNQTMMRQWVEKADLIAVDRSRTDFISLNPGDWQILPTPEAIWPEDLTLYLKPHRLKNE